MANPYSSKNIGEQETWDMRGFFVDYQRVAFWNFRQARDEDNFPEMLRLIDEIHSEVFGRVKDKWNSKDTLYKKLRLQIIKKAVKYSDVWTGKRKDHKGLQVIRNRFNKLVEYVFHLIDQNELFGRRRRADVL